MDPAILDLPRSVHLALWLPHVHDGASDVGRAVEAIEDSDEPHTIRTDGDVPAMPVEGLAGLLGAWGGRPLTVAAVLPVPGDVAGVPAPVSGAAVDAGECVLVSTPEGSFAAVPEIETFGTATETGYLVDWRISRVPPWSLPVLAYVGSLPDAERDLRSALITATDALESLDLDNWRADAAEALATLRAVPWPLPPGLDPHRSRVLALAARLRLIIELATADDGGAVNLWQADRRAAMLRQVDHAARRAVCAATLVP